MGNANNLGKLSRDEVVLAWLNRGVFQLFYAFEVENEHGNNLTWLDSLHKSFHLAIGFELICKSYLIGKAYCIYSDMARQQAKQTVDKYAKNFSHDYSNMVKEICKYPYIAPKLSNILNKKCGGTSGRDFIKVLEKGVSEFRYPVPEPFRLKTNVVSVEIIPSMGTDLYDFCIKFCSVIVKEIEFEFNVALPINKLKQKMGALGDDFFQGLLP
jgi:hypothetical protein